MRRTEVLQGLRRMLGLGAVDEDELYRALDLLGEAHLALARGALLRAGALRLQPRR